MGADTTSAKSLISLSELSRLWGLDRKTIKRNLIRAGIHPYYINDARNGSIRFERREVESFLEGCKG